jgi:hypothetical protein
VRRKRSVRWTRTWSNRWATRRSLLLTWRRRDTAVAPVTTRGWRMTTHCDLWECSSCTESRMTTFFWKQNTHMTTFLDRTKNSIMLLL